MGRTSPKVCLVVRPHHSTEEPGRETGKLESVCGTNGPQQRPMPERALDKAEVVRSLAESGAEDQVTRFVGLDIHRTYATVAAVDRNQQVVLTARRVDYEHFDEW